MLDGGLEASGPAEPLLDGVRFILGNSRSYAQWLYEQRVPRGQAPW